MILQALNEYYDRKQASPDPRDRLPALGFEEKEIPFIVEVTAKGELVNIIDTRSQEGKKLVAQRFLVPKGVKKSSGIAANLLWGTAEYALGIDTKGKPERVAKQHAAFRARIEGLSGKFQTDPGLQAVLAFLDRTGARDLANRPCWEDLQKNPLISFRLHGDLELVCQRLGLTAADVREESKEQDQMCLVTGEFGPAERLHPAIKGVWGAQTSGANIVSFNRGAFRSYNKDQGDNAAVGRTAAFAYTTALNHLLAKGSRQRVQVGDASTVFWADRPHNLETMVPDLFGEAPRDDPDRGTEALKALYRSAASGNFSLGNDNTQFHVLGLAPNATRISIRFYEKQPAHALAGRLRQHFDDLTMVRSPRDPEHLSLFRILTGVAVQGKAENIPPNLGGDIIRSIIGGLPYPATLLNQAVKRCRAEQKVNYTRAATLKACLNRNIRQSNQDTNEPQHEFNAMLNTNNTDNAYRLGRLFAALEKTQEDALPGLNATIRDRYYGAASSTPAAVFSTLLRLKNHHISKLENRGLATNREKLIGEIMDGLDKFPGHLPLPAQARFALGYYHQRQDFFKKKEKNNETPKN